MTTFHHISVLKNEVVNLLTEDLPNDQELYFADLTFGGGGHVRAILEKVKSAKFKCVDQDIEAIENGRKILAELGVEEKVELVHANFSEFPFLCKSNFLDVQRQNGFQGILLDIGVSSHQFDMAERGFSFQKDAALDMRMNRNQELTAEGVVNTYSEEDLQRIFFEYGEEKFAKRIAQEIVLKRKNSFLKTTKDLENLIFHCYPKKMRFGKTHPATRCFQALRIEVNNELGVLRDVLGPLMELLRPGGRLAVISFHSLEDRIVKQAFKEKERLDKHFKAITKRPVIPSDDEILANKRSRSAKLRVIERLTEEAYESKRKYRSK